ncbi:MAG: hypothetical protein WCK67_07915 [bacterium]
MALTLLDIYNKVTGQAWSIDDTDISTEDGVEQKVLTSIQKALRVIWDSYPYSFKLKNMTLNTISGQTSYDQPIGKIIDKGIWLIQNIGDPIEIKNKPDNQGLNFDTGTPEYFYIKYNKLNFYPIPDDIYQISIDYNSFRMGIDENDIPIFNLKSLTDRLDIPEMFEDIFLTALMNKAMINSIADSTNENYTPYITQFIESYKTMLDSISGVESTPRILW